MTESTAVDYLPRTNGILGAARVSTAVDSNPQLQDVVEGLKWLGHTRADSVNFAEAAMEALIQEGNSAPSHEEFMLRAIQCSGGK